MAAGDRIFMAKESTSQEILSNTKFENDVKMYGTQTKHREIIKDSYTWNFKNVAYSA